MSNQAFYIGWLKFWKVHYRYDIEIRDNKLALVDRMNNKAVLDLGMNWEWLRPFNIDKLVNFFKWSPENWNEEARDKNRYIPRLAQDIIYGKTIITSDDSKNAIANQLKKGDYLQAVGSGRCGSASLLVHDLSYFKGGKHKGQVKYVVDAPYKNWGAEYPAKQMTAHALNSSPYYVGNGLFLKRGNVVYMVE